MANRVAARWGSPLRTLGAHPAHDSETRAAPRCPRRGLACTPAPFSTRAKPEYQKDIIAGEFQGELKTPEAVNIKFLHASREDAPMAAELQTSGEDTAREIDCAARTLVQTSFARTNTV